MIENFAAKLDEYARLLVEVGLNLQPGQTPRIAAPVECAPLARLCAAACLERGARDVVMDWTDDVISRERYLHSQEDVFSEFPPYLQSELDWLLEHNCPSLSITGSDPEMLKGVDPKRILAWKRTSGAHRKRYLDAMTANQFQWSIGAYPTQAWAEKVFPDKQGQDAVDALWDAIFTVCRIRGDGQGVVRWKQHIADSAARCQKLNEMELQSLHYTNALGTDLTIELPENHIWLGGSDMGANGVDFVANIPTEEIFSAPKRDGVNGRACAAMPLALNGYLIRDFYLDFKDGKIVNVHAGEGEDILKDSIAMDEGSSYLGEVALVPYSSPIRSTGILFFNTLFDENASCHLAFGDSYPSCVKGAEELDEEGKKALGLNQSTNHVDFMVGTSDLSIVGKTRDGREIPVFVGGNFAF